MKASTAWNNNYMGYSCVVTSIDTRIYAQTHKKNTILQLGSVDVLYNYVLTASMKIIKI